MLCRQCLRGSALRSARWYSASTDAAPPPLLAKMRVDLKNAMRAKDTTRLNVLRSVISEINNASKTPKPVTSDLQILRILRKKSADAKDAAEQFLANKREDLKARQDAEGAVLDEYARSVVTVPDELIEQAVKDAIAGGANNIGTIMKNVFKNGGSLEGKPIEGSKIAQFAKQLLPS